MASGSTRRTPFATSPKNTLSAQSVAPRARPPGRVQIILIAENDLQESKMTQPRNAGGDDLDGMWNDDFHHSAIVALTGNNVGYYSDYSGKPQEFISAAKHGFLYQGQALSWRKGLARNSGFRCSRGGVSSVSSKTTTRSRIPAPANDRAFKLLPDAIAP